MMMMMIIKKACAVQIKKPGGICRQIGRSTNTDCQNAPTHHQLSSVTGSWTPQDRNTERNKTSKGKHNRENKKW
jgi:hypothetical protein